MPAQIRVFIAQSLDGFIAAPGDDLSWLPTPLPGQDYGYAEHMKETAAILMGRATYDVVAAFDPWPYGETPVFVATNRPLDAPQDIVRAVSGDPLDLIAAVQAEVGEGGIYVDGGVLIRSILDAGLVDELTISVVPVVLGSGTPLFAGALRRHELELISAEAFDDGLVQLKYVVEI